MLIPAALPPILLLTLLMLGACDGASEPVTTAEQMQLLRVQSEAYEGFGIAQLQADAVAMELGQALLEAHCAQCHGENASSLIGATNLVAGIFDYGSTAADIRTTIAAGRHSLMPALGNVLGEVELGSLVAYVRSFNTGEPLTNFAETARELFETNCVVCHGPQASGNPVLGAPNLTDSYWQHGGSMMNVRLTITRGVESQSPAYGDILTATEIELLTAYILNLRKL